MSEAAAFQALTVETLPSRLGGVEALASRIGGDPAGALASAAREAGMPDAAVTWTTSSSAAADLILPWLAGGDLVLVKGSRGIRTDTVVDRITAEFS